MKKPFFAKFLEKQVDTEVEAEVEEKRAEGDALPVQTDLKAGRPITTLKYPSDRDEFVTLKYPSDDDEDIVRF